MKYSSRVKRNENFSEKLFNITFNLENTLENISSKKEKEKVRRGI